MPKSIFHLVLLSCLLNSYLPLVSQVFILDDLIDGTAEITCSGTFYDSGGPLGDYQNNEDYVVTFCSNMPGENITLSMVIDTEPIFDQLSFFDGPSTSSPEFSGSPYEGNTSFSLTTTGECLTVAFSSGNIFTGSGWEGEISCSGVTPCSAEITMTNITASSCFPCNGSVGFSENGIQLPAELNLYLDGDLILNEAFSGMSLDITELCAGNYLLELLSADNCIYTETFEILAGQIPSCTVSGVTDFCEGSSVNLTLELTGTGPWTLEYVLDGFPQIPIDIPSTPFYWNINQPGLYDLVSINDLNCSTSLTDSYSIAENSAPFAVLSGNGSYCAGSAADLEIFSTGTAPWTISYSIDGLPQADIVTADEIHILQVSTPGLYELTSVNDATCNGQVAGQVDVLEVLPPAATLSGGGAMCEGETVPVILEITGDGPFTLIYALDGAEQPSIELPFPLFTIDVSEAGTYTLVSVSSSGCAGTVSGEAIVEVTPLPSIDFPAGGALEMCQGGSVDFPIELTGNGPWTLEYTVDFGSPIILDIVSNTYFFTADQPGFYSFNTVTDQSCTSNTGIIIDIGISESPTASLNQDVQFCIGSSGNLPVTLSEPGTYELTFAIDGIPQSPISINDLNGIIPVSTEGNYSLISLTQGACEGNVLGVSTVTSTDPPVATLSGNISFCAGDTGEAEVNLSGTGPWILDYAINGTAQGPVENAISPVLLPVSEAGIVSLVSIVDQVCTGTTGAAIQAIEHPLPSVVIGGDAVICEGSVSILDIVFNGSPDFQADLLLNGGFYQLLESNTPNLGVNVQEMGTYTLSNVGDTHCDGSASGSASISFYDEPSVAVPLDTALCIGDALTLIGSASDGAGGPYSYAWVNGNDTLAGNQISLAPTLSQALTFLVTDACAIPFAQQIAITVYQTPVVEIANDISELCGNTEVILDTQTPLEEIGQNCIWYIGTDTIFGCETLNYTFTTEGTYDVGLFVTTLEGCSSESFYPEFITINTRPEADFDFNPAVPNIVENQVSFIDLSTDAFSYEWYLDSLVFSEAADPVLVLPSLESSESWTVCQVITSSLGCTDTLCKKLNLAGELAVFVPEAFTPDGDEVNDFFFPIIVGGSEEEYFFQIFDRLGNIVWESKDIHAKWSGQGADDSSYFTGDGVYTWRIEVKRKNSVDKRLFTGIVTVVR